MVESTDHIVSQLLWFCVSSFHSPFVCLPVGDLFSLLLSTFAGLPHLFGYVSGVQSPHQRLTINWTVCVCLSASVSVCLCVSVWVCVGPLSAKWPQKCAQFFAKVEGDSITKETCTNKCQINCGGQTTDNCSRQTITL